MISHTSSVSKLTTASTSPAAKALQYHVQILQGTPPATAGPCVLFIDPLGRPLSPVSVAGVRRRDMRRDRRRL
jgi:hypothetical protein